MMQAMGEQERTEPKRRCTATRKDGKPCGAFALSSGLCYGHDPARQADREAARARGGRNSSTAARLRGAIPARLLPIYDKLELALNEVHTGALDTRRATAMAALARALVAVLQAGELEDRLRQLEANIELSRTG
ncbi:MAG: hypothetical protein Q7O66_23080 [Dehalococcoidia bacterium]|nr:hypothetical protein [Dehalococcoidia bacterium]